MSNPSSSFLNNSDHQLNELSGDSYESTSLLAITPPPTKPPRQNDESSSSSSIEINSPPPAKPPRHFSVYKNADELNILRRTTADQFVQLQTSNSLKNIDKFTVEPIRIAVKTDVPLKTEVLDHLVTVTSFSSTIKQSNIVDRSTDQIVSYATNLTKMILQEVKKDIQKSNHEILFNKLSKIEEQQQQTSRDNPPSFPHSIVTTHVSPMRSTKRPLMFVSLDSESRLTPISSPLLDIVTIKPIPIFTTSVTVTSPPSPVVSSTTTVTNSDEDLNSTSTLISNSSKYLNRSTVLEISSKRSSIESNDLTTYDNTIFLSQTTGNATPARSLISDYDNLHGSYGSLNDDNQATQIGTPLLPSSSSSMTTIYESLDNFPSSSSTATSPTYVSAVSTFNTDGRRTPSQGLNSDISDEDLVESFDIERSSQGTSTEMFIYPWHVFDLFFSHQLAWPNHICLSEKKISFIF